jgi:large subunit ribosomal protein L10
VASLALSPAQRIVSLANAPAAGLMGQLKTIAEPADGEASPEADAPAAAVEG